MPKLESESTQNKAAKDTAKISEKERRDILAHYIQNYKKIYLPFGEIKKNESLMKFASENIGVWFGDPDMPLIKMEDAQDNGKLGKEIVSKIIYYIDKDSNLMELELDYKKLPITDDLLKIELEALGFRDYFDIAKSLTDNSSERRELAAGRENIVHEGAKYQNELKKLKNEQSKKNETEDFGF